MTANLGPLAFSNKLTNLGHNVVLKALATASSPDDFNEAKSFWSSVENDESGTIDVPSTLNVANKYLLLFFLSSSMRVNVSLVGGIPLPADILIEGNGKRKEEKGR